MLTGDLKNQVDKVWSRFWSGGMANPLEIIEQITYLLFLKRLDDLQTLAENKSRRLGRDRPEWLHHLIGLGDRGY